MRFTFQWENRSRCDSTPQTSCTSSGCRSWREKSRQCPVIQITSGFKPTNPGHISAFARNFAAHSTHGCTFCSSRSRRLNFKNGSRRNERFYFEVYVVAPELWCRMLAKAAPHLSRVFLDCRSTKKIAMKQQLPRSSQDEIADWHARPLSCCSVRSVRGRGPRRKSKDVRFLRCRRQMLWIRNRHRRARFTIWLSL